MHKSFDEIFEGDVDKVKNLPVQSLLPLLLIRHMGAMTQRFLITPDYIEFGMNMEEWARGKWGSDEYEEVHRQKKNKLLKNIKSEFI